ncbi:MAG: hypothetical protein NVSMB51_09770 [Solirubrobacteraceae bacterium]
MFDEQPGTGLTEYLGRDRTAALHRLLRERALAWGQRVAPGRTYLAADSAAGAGAATWIDSPLAEPYGVRLRSAAVAVAGGPLLIAGVRCPSLRAAHAAAALADLRAGCGITIGPAIGGGLYLIGVGEPEALELAEQLVRGPALLGSALASAHGAGLSIGLLRSERELAGAGDVAALLLDPLAEPGLVSLLGRA